MKNVILLICAAVAIGATLLVRHRSIKNSDTDDVDGGVRHYHDDGAPKSVSSDVITDFLCEGRRTFSDDNGNENTIRYRASVKADGSTVKCSYKYHDRFGHSDHLIFTADLSVTRQLYLLFVKYDLAQYNGITYRVSGLPSGFGSVISIDFEGGERVYSSNNQSCFLSDEFGAELFEVMKTYADSGVKNGEGEDNERRN